MSVRPKSGKKTKKEKPKPPKVQIKELTEANELLTQELNTLKNEAEDMRNKLTAVNSKIITGLDKKSLQKCYNITESTPPLSINTDYLLDMLGKLIVKKEIRDVSVEARMEELESRVTELNMSLAKASQKTVAYELGLDDLTKCKSLDEVKDRVYELQYLAGQAYHSITSIDPYHLGRHFPATVGLDGTDDTPDSDTLRSIDTARKLNLVPPSKKYPGETTISNMHPDLKLYLIRELSLEKASGADWRMFAERVGIPSADVEDWQAKQLNCPMGRVFDRWSVEEPDVSVRLLHRHLKSPQMRCTLLAKRVADFFEVD